MSHGHHHASAHVGFQAEEGSLPADDNDSGPPQERDLEVCCCQAVMTWLPLPCVHGTAAATSTIMHTMLTAPFVDISSRCR